MFGGLNVHWCFIRYLNFQLVSEQVHLLWFHYLSVILDPLCLFTMDSALYAFMHVLDVDECNMSCFMKMPL